MKAFDILNAMEYVPEAMLDEAIQSLQKRQGLKTMRLGLLAACLCIALMGTVLAFSIAGVTIFVDRQENGEQNVQEGFSYSGELIRLPVDMLSEKARADAADFAQSTQGENVELFGDPAYVLHSMQKNVSSWEEAEIYLGLDLLNNYLLDASKLTDRDNLGQPYCTVVISTRGQEGKTTYSQISDVSVFASYDVSYETTKGEQKESQVRVKAYVLTQMYPHDREKNPLKMSYENRITQIEQKEYITANGQPASLVCVQTDDYTDYYGICILNGTMIVVDTLTGDEELICQLLDAFYESN